MSEKIRAIIINTAIGDTLGMPVELWKKNQIRRYLPGGISQPIAPVMIKNKDGSLITKDEDGKLWYLNHGLTIGDVTDDTLLTLAVAESIGSQKGLDLDDIARRHVLEYQNNPSDEENGLYKFGRTTVEAIKNLLEGKSPLESGVVGGPGNAPAMKMSPVGIYMNITGDPESGLLFAQQVGGMTHRDARSLVSGVVQANAVSRLLEGVNRVPFIKDLVEICEANEKVVSIESRHHHKGSLAGYLKWVYDNRDVSDDLAHQYLGSSSDVFSSYPFAIFMFQRYWNKPIDGMLRTVNYGGDCDTTGAMYGSLVGARDGLVFPNSWMMKIRSKDRLEKAAEGLVSLRS